MDWSSRLSFRRDKLHDEGHAENKGVRPGSGVGHAGYSDTTILTSATFCVEKRLPSPHLRERVAGSASYYQGCRCPNILCIS